MDEAPDAGNLSWEGQAETVGTGGSGARLLYLRFSKSSEEFRNLQSPPAQSQDEFQRRRQLIFFENTKMARSRSLRKVVSVDGLQEQYGWPREFHPQEMMRSS